MAVSISGLRAEFDIDGNMSRFIERVRAAAAAEISARLGWSGEGWAFKPDVRC